MKSAKCCWQSQLAAEVMASEAQYPWNSLGL